MPLKTTILSPVQDVSSKIVPSNKMKKKKRKNKKSFCVLFHHRLPLFTKTKSKTISKKMETNIYYHSECDFQLQNEDSISEWLKHAIRLEKKALGEINYIFCDDEYLLKKNQDFLNHDTLTDIITFDYSEENKLSADIFISIERVKENALIFAVPFEKELKRVIIHGILHLIGYKDKSEEETKTMRSKENFYLAITI